MRVRAAGLAARVITPIVAVLAMAMAAPAFGATPAVTPDAASLLTGATSLTSNGDGYCAIVTGGGVDCWGEGSRGELGDGKSYSFGHRGSATPVQVKGFGGVGTLTGARTLVSDQSGYCALLDNGGVACWGSGEVGELGDGSFHSASAIGGSALPVQVRGVGRVGALSGVISLLANTYFEDPGYCALLSTGRVVCWGAGEFGELGDGRFTRPGHGSAVPVPVSGVGGVGALSGVIGLANDGLGYCALLGTGGVVCWGYGYFGDLGNGKFYRGGYEGSAVPVRVVGVGRAGTLTGAVGLTGFYQGYCASMPDAGLDCWGFGAGGELGNGKRYDTGSQASPVPTQVVGVGRAGTLSGVSDLVANGNTSCAVVSGGTVDCWGYGVHGELGNGKRPDYPGFPGSPLPVQVKGVGGSGLLTGVRALSAVSGSCAVLTDGGIDCWGDGRNGSLGNGKFYRSGPGGSAVPVQVEGVGGTGSLGGVSFAIGDGFSTCAIVSGGGVDCWGAGADGRLGNGASYSESHRGSAVPVQVMSPAV